VPSNFKKMVRARMAETGESWQAAARYIRGLKKAPQEAPDKQQAKEKPPEGRKK
jgi:hypothetical protein